jgi:hypothetical protein
MAGTHLLKVKILHERRDNLIQHPIVIRPNFYHSCCPS